MIYIVCALKSEAQALVENYKLHKTKLLNYTMFSNDNMRILISGMGVDASRLATQTFINQFDITDDDCYINLGVCAGSKKYNIGDIVEIGTIIYQDIHYCFSQNKEMIGCFDLPQTDPSTNLADMESYGFYDAVIHNPAIKKFLIIKIISDHFEPATLTKDGVKALIYNQRTALDKYFF